MMRLIKASVLCIAIGFTATVMAESDTMKIERAESAAHSDLSARATIVDNDGRMLREGSIAWHCMPGIPVMEGDTHPMCNDEVWAKLLQAAAEGKPFETDRIGISYMLGGDAYVSNSNPAATDPNNGDVWVREGPHIMIVVPKEGANKSCNLGLDQAFTLPA